MRHYIWEKSKDPRFAPGLSLIRVVVGLNDLRSKGKVGFVIIQQIGLTMQPFSLSVLQDSSAPSWSHRNNQSQVGLRESHRVEDDDNLNEKRPEPDIFSQAVASAEIDDFASDSGIVSRLISLGCEPGSSLVSDHWVVFSKLSCCFLYVAISVFVSKLEELNHRSSFYGRLPFKAGSFQTW